MQIIKHTELKGGYTSSRKIIIGAAKLSANEYEVMTMYEDGDEIEYVTKTSEAEALKAFDDMIYKYAEPLQKAIYSAGLVEGEKYTLVYINDFGFPVAQKITFHSMKFCTYAQHSDCVKIDFIPFRKRTSYTKIFHNASLLIFKGWQNLKDDFAYETVSENDKVKIKKSKYCSFDSRYIDDAEKIMKNPVLIYKDYKTGKNGKVYA